MSWFAGLFIISCQIWYGRASAVWPDSIFGVELRQGQPGSVLACIAQAFGLIGSLRGTLIWRALIWASDRSPPFLTQDRKVWNFPRDIWTVRMTILSSLIMAGIVQYHFKPVLKCSRCYPRNRIIFECRTHRIGETWLSNLSKAAFHISKRCWVWRKGRSFSVD